MTERRSSQAGFTLVELMISLVLFSFAMAGVLSIAVVTTRSFREQRRAIQMEAAARAPLDYLVDAVRGASPAAPSGAIGDADNCVMIANALAVTDSSTAPDELDVVYAAGGVVTTTYSAFDKTSTSITIPSGQLANFAAGDYVLISNTSAGTIVQVTGVTATALTIASHNSCANTSVFPASGFPAGSILVRAQHAHFLVAPLDGIPALWMDPDGTAGAAVAEPLAEGVEDMQIAIGRDSDNSGYLNAESTTANADEWYGNVLGDTTPTTGSIRAIKIVLVARDTTALLGTPSFYRPAALNHAVGATADGYRRRVLSSIVEIRNLTGSP